MLNELKIVKPRVDQTLGVSRKDMPQIKGKYYDALFDYLEDNGVSYKKTKVRVNDLQAMQKEFSDDGVVRSILKSNKQVSPKALIISKDHYVIDGHHRWLAKLNTNRNALVNAFQLNIDGLQALKLIKGFKHVSYKDIYEEILSEMSDELKQKINQKAKDRHMKMALTHMYKLMQGKGEKHGEVWAARQIGKTFTDVPGPRELARKYREVFGESVELDESYESDVSAAAKRLHDQEQKGGYKVHTAFKDERDAIAKKHHADKYEVETDIRNKKYQLQGSKTRFKGGKLKEESNMNTFAKVRSMLNEESGLSKAVNKAEKKRQKALEQARKLKAAGKSDQAIKDRTGLEDWELKKLKEQLDMLDKPQLDERKLPVTPRDPLVTVWDKGKSTYDGEGIVGHMNLSTSAHIKGFDAAAALRELNKAGKSEGKRVAAKTRDGKVVWLEWSKWNKDHFKEDVDQLDEEKDGNKDFDKKRKGKLDPVDKDQATDDFEDREDDDLDNDGNTDDSDRYIHKKRKAVTKAVQKEDTQEKSRYDFPLVFEY